MTKFAYNSNCARCQFKGILGKMMSISDDVCMETCIDQIGRFQE